MRVDAVTPAQAEIEGFLVALETLAQAVRRTRGAVAPTDSGDHLTLSQYSLLSPLAAGEPVRVSDLAAQVGVAPSTTSRILDALERRGIVRRTRSRRDRRQVTVSLTSRGRRALERHDAWMRGRQTAFFAALPQGERDVVSDLLTRLAELIDELSAGPPGPPSGD